jgi:hypothetical protein
MIIIVRLSGGLGNQLFQLNAGIYAAKTLSTHEIFLDTRFLSKYQTGRDFGLKFTLNHLTSFSFCLEPTGLSAWASKLRLGRIFDSSLSKYAFVNSFSRLQKLSRNTFQLVVLDGYFQCPNITLPKIERSALFAKLSQEYSYVKQNYFLNASIPLVSIHIRRGDFVTLKAAAVHFFPSNVCFMVFGDDPLITGEFAKEIGGIDIASRRLSLIEEFMLMALCDHSIIANSTFSWWAAYLGDRIGKRVIAPRDWYVDPLRSQSNPLPLPHFELLSTI